MWADLETFSEVPIEHGTYKYAANAEVMIVSYAFAADDPVQVWDVTADPKMPGDLEYMLFDDDGEIGAHNAMFDRTVMNRAPNFRKYPKIKLERWRCTMVKALAHSLPGGLDKLCTILKVDADKAKAKDGRALIHLFCKPRPKNANIRRATRHTHPEEWQRFLDYAGLDITSMRVVDRKLPTWNYRAEELALYHLDQRINDRGFCVDTDLATAAIRAVDLAKRTLSARTQVVTNQEVESTTKRDQLLAHILKDYGIDLPDLQMSTLERRIADPDLPIQLRELLGIRLQATTTSNSKYASLLRAVSDDGRLRGTLQFNGANRTGRWAGRTFQPHNLPRPTPGFDEAAQEEAVEALKSDCADLVSNNVMQLASNSIRGSIIAPPGKKLVIADLANIEGRMLAWLAGEEWKLQAFRDYDAGHGPDLYKLAYANSFKIDHTLVTKDQRQVGKVEELMLGYEGGVGAFLTGAATYGFDVEDLGVRAFDTLPADVRREAEGFLDWSIRKKRSTYGLTVRAFVTCDGIKRLWRRAHPMTEALWANVKQAAIDAIQNPGNTFRVRDLLFGCEGAWLRIRLPSGRYLCYPFPRTDGSAISYMGMNQYTRQWSRISTYGGKLVENITQAASRDALAHGMVLAEAHGYEEVLTVHDEGLTETPDTDDYSSDGLSALMSTVPAWAPGLPLAAAGFETYRYRKD